ncbi:MAG: DUF1648 domain-containing protein, partial [Nitrososphaeria archaeon]
MSRSEVLILVLVLLSFCIGVCLYPFMPEKVAVHWNVKGEVDGYLPRFWGLFLFPFIFAGIVLLFIVIPRIDPLKKNIELFRRYYDGFVLLFSLFFLLVYVQVILWNIGVKVNLTVTLPIGIG